MKYRGSFVIIFAVLSVLSISIAAQPVVISSDSASTDLFKQGGVAYLKGDYANAIKYFRMLFDREKENPTLSKVYWYVLIDNLGMAYGISGKLDNAEEIFKYGISKDSTYPLFYYSLACTYAEREDMDHCITYLKTAFRFKDNMLAGETFPDPMLDDSFQRFAKNQDFVNAVKEMKAANQKP